MELDFDRLARRSPFELSEGEQRRLAIAGVLAMLSARPEQARSMLILDEPTAGLDYQGTRQIAGILKRLHAAGRTIVLITHEDEVGARADRLIRLFDGKISSDTRQEPAGRHAVAGKKS